MQPRDDSGPVHFLDPADAEELTSALRAEGYEVSGEACDGPGRATWALRVAPYDDGLAAMVDVYGGWLPEETPGS